MGEKAQARAQYEAAARYSTAYYGQLARAKLGMTDVSLRRPPELSGAERAALRNTEVVRAVEMLYAVEERDLVLSIFADLGEKSSNVGVLTVLGEIAAHHRDARGMLQLGKAALGRGHPFEIYAFPDVGIPKYAAAGPEIDRSLLYAVARQESAFNQKVVSIAKAMGLMQVTRDAARHTAKRFGLAFDVKRLLNDAIYNTQMGAAELAGLLQDYRGSYIMTFAGYNAGRGRIREWVARYGDPRDPQVDPIDWVERIPFSETRNYVQRVMENMHVYRARLGGPGTQTVEADLYRGARQN
jgi:soluble lytic murein transglycosylase